MLNVGKYRGRNLSGFRTLNTAKYFAEITSPQDAVEAFGFACEKKLQAFVLGGGSNVFFKNTRIKSFILRNKLPKEIKYLGGDRFEISSSVSMIELLKYMYAQSRECCYYLASAPCQVGGAIAMNAGSGIAENRTISDYIESVSFVEGVRGIFSKRKPELGFSYRKSFFSDRNDVFITSAVFKFPKTEFAENPISARLEWAKKNQDLTAPNCGSLCNLYDARIMSFTRSMFRCMPAGISKKKLNWAYNNAKNPIALRMCLATLTMLHRIFGKKIKYEIKIIE